MPEVLTEVPKSVLLVKRFQERRLDAEVHRIVFGKECCWDSAMVPEIAALCSKEQADLSVDFIQLDEHGKHITGMALPGGPIRIIVPRYSASIEAAMQVVEKIASELPDNSVMRNIGFARLRIYQYADGTWKVSFTKRGGSPSATADTLPEAICRAALAATEQKK